MAGAIAWQTNSYARIAKAARDAPTKRKNWETAKKKLAAEAAAREANEAAKKKRAQEKRTAGKKAAPKRTKGGQASFSEYF